MTVQYVVEAEVYDIGQTVPRAEDLFLVDSNVWLWLTYTNAGHAQPGWRMTLIGQYAQFLQNAITADVNLCWCELSLAELSHVIEKTEREIYESTTGNAIKAKEFRHNLPHLRTAVVAEINAAWAQISSIAHPLPVTIDTATAISALARLQTEKVDSYDFFILEAMRSQGVVQVITDDGDFATIPGIQLFTANRNVIQAASAQGKLMVR